MNYRTSPSAGHDVTTASYNICVPIALWLGTINNESNASHLVLSGVGQVITVDETGGHSSATSTSLAVVS